jgi:hypothetical protein
MSTSVATTEKFTLPAKGVAIVGRTGAGKSTAFYGCTLVDTMIVSDPGSMGHRVTFRGAGGVKIVTCGPKDPSPIDQVKAIVTECEERGAIWALDSWSTLIDRQIVHAKGKRGGSVDLKAYGEIVMSLRDLALWLSEREGIVVFNTSPGGSATNPITKEIEEIPAGCLTGFGSLAGIKGKEETILKFWSTVYILVGPVPEAVGDDGKVTRAAIPRGFILPGRDFRPPQQLRSKAWVKPSDYAPIKDPLGVLTVGVENDDKARVWPVPSPGEECAVDKIIRAMNARARDIAK